METNMDDKTVKADLMVVQLDRARTALAEAKTIGETKKVMDIAHAAYIYAVRQQLGEEAIGYAHSIKTEALRKLGGILKVTPKAKPGRKTDIGRDTRPISATLKELRITKDTSTLAQKLAALPAEVFELVRDRSKSLTAALSALRKQSIKADLVSDWQVADRACLHRRVVRSQRCHLLSLAVLRSAVPPRGSA